MSKCKVKPVVLSCFKEYQKYFISEAPNISLKVPSDLSLLYIAESANWNSEKIYTYCESVLKTWFLSKEDIDYTVSQTRQQNKSVLWFKLRGGRITSSTAYECITTSLANPAISLVKKICSFAPCNMSSEAIFWGTNHEHFALEAYKNNMIQNSHINVILSESGLVLSESILWLGCSPDELCYCDCCGTRLVEIKCPFKHRQNMQAEDL